MVGFPLLLIPLAIYNIIVFLMPGVSLGDPLVTLPLTSGAAWPVTLGDILLAIGIVVLLLEVIKGARPGAKYLTDHLLSLIVCGGAIAEFLLWPRFGNSILRPRLCRKPRPPLRSPNPCCWSIRSPKLSSRKLRQPRRRRKWCPQARIQTPACRGPRTHRRINSKILEPGSDLIRTGLQSFILTRFLHANRHPLRLKTL